VFGDGGLLGGVHIGGPGVDVPILRDRAGRRPCVHPWRDAAHAGASMPAQREPNLQALRVMARPGLEPGTTARHTSPTRSRTRWRSAAPRIRDRDVLGLPARTTGRAASEAAHARFRQRLQQWPVAPPALPPIVRGRRLVAAAGDGRIRL
jgi:hypothetical protein